MHCARPIAPTGKPRKIRSHILWSKREERDVRAKRFVPKPFLPSWEKFEIVIESEFIAWSRRLARKRVHVDT
jgi:hypothetical protein